MIDGREFRRGCSGRSIEDLERRAGSLHLVFCCNVREETDRLGLGKQVGEKIWASLPGLLLVAVLLFTCFLLSGLFFSDLPVCVLFSKDLMDREERRI